MAAKKPAARGWLLNSNSRNLTKLSVLERFRGSFQASCTDTLSNFPSVLIESSFLNIRLKLSFSALHREAHVVAKLRSLATYVAFSHNHTSS